MTAGRIELRNFAVFEVKRRKPRRARNPRTGEQVKVPAKLVVTFKLGKEMEQRVRKLKGHGSGVGSSLSTPRCVRRRGFGQRAHHLAKGPCAQRSG
jgi:Bacterial DNA-binding protein